MAGCALLIGSMDYFAQPIQHLLPHAEPMILIHGLVELGETWLIAAVDLSRPTLFTGPSGTPAYVALEYMAQAIAAYAGSQNAARNLPPQIGFYWELEPSPARRWYCRARAQRWFAWMWYSPKRPVCPCSIVLCFG